MTSPRVPNKRKQYLPLITYYHSIYASNKDELMISLNFIAKLTPTSGHSAPFFISSYQDDEMQLKYTVFCGRDSSRFVWIRFYWHSARPDLTLFSVNATAEGVLKRWRAESCDFPKKVFANTMIFFIVIYGWWWAKRRSARRSLVMRNFVRH